MSVTLTPLTAALSRSCRIDRELGAGGMATVYLAHDIRHDRQVAIKVLKPELGAVLGAERFPSEIKVTAKLQHPNLLPLFDSGAADGFRYYVMPYIEGETLRATLDREQQLPADDTRRLLGLIADGMADELTTALGKVPGLRVAARTSAFSFKGRRDLDVGEVGEKLGVTRVLEGTVLAGGISFSPELVPLHSDPRFVGLIKRLGLPTGAATQ